MLLQRAISGDLANDCFSWLAIESLNLGHLRWPIRPKHHQLSHLTSGIRRDLRNPKYFGCINDEDMLGQVCSVARVCHRRSIPVAVLTRYLLRIVRRWKGYKPALPSRKLRLRKRCVKPPRVPRPRL
jgi:hypothetical protein